GRPGRNRHETDTTGHSAPYLDCVSAPQHAPRMERLPFVESPLTRLATLLVVAALGAAGLAATAQSQSAVRLTAGRSTLPAAASGAAAGSRTGDAARPVV